LAQKRHSVDVPNSELSRFQ